MAAIELIDPVQATLNERFRYEPDHGEYWKIPTGDGAWPGDCEDYALKLAHLREDEDMRRFWWSLIICRYVIWYVHSPRGIGHVVIWTRGRGWTDNIQRKRVATWAEMRRLGYRRKFPMLAPLVALKFGLRNLTGKAA